MTNVPEKGSELAATTNQLCDFHNLLSFELYNLLSLRCCTNYNICIYSRYNTLFFTTLGTIPLVNPTFFLYLELSLLIMIPNIDSFFYK
jgi:hypothetical protein